MIEHISEVFSEVASTSDYSLIREKLSFEEKNYFGYPKDMVYFFKQGELPLIDISGNLILEEPYKIKEASNVNGDVFHSMKNFGILDDIIVF